MSAPLELLEGNAIALLETGQAYFPALETAIASAQNSIYLETYIFENDALGRRIAQALEDAVKRGILVRVLVDGFGSRAFVTSLLPTLQERGVEVQVYRREISRFSLRRHRLRRLHRKLAVIDGRLAFVGGINIINDFDASAPSHPRHDYAVRIEGPLVQPILASVLHLWRLVSWAGLRRRPHPIAPPMVAAAYQPVGRLAGALVLRDNLRHRKDIEDSYLQAFQKARREILIANAYFLPGLRFRQALVEAAQRGVKVVLLLQGRSDHPFQQYATRALYPHLLANGIELFEYRRSFLHAKVAVIDEQWCTVGSSNIDPFSLLLAREANVIVVDQAFARDLRRSLQQAIKDGARRLSQSHWKRLPLPKRLASWIAYQLVRLAIGLAGYGGRH